MRSVLTPAVPIVLHVHLQLFGHLPPEFKKRTAKVTFPQAHALADVASAVTDSTENRTFQEQSRFKNTMKTPRHLMGRWLSLILPPLEQRIAEVCPCGARRGEKEYLPGKGTPHREKPQPIFLPLASGDTPLTTQGHKEIRDCSGLNGKNLHLKSLAPDRAFLVLCGINRLRSFSCRWTVCCSIP